MPRAIRRWAAMYYLMCFPLGYWFSVEHLGAYSLLACIGALYVYAALGSWGCLDWLNPVIAPGALGYLVGRLCRHIPNDAERERLREPSTK
jgi:hypothetical protein